jgi:DNA-binding MarR family transcriptional regulator
MVSRIRKFIRALTSREAHEKVVETEVKVGQQGTLLALINKFPRGLINGELADRSGLGREQVFRRMPELEQQGYVERRYTEEGKIVNRRYKGYNQQVWFPKEKKNG